MPPTHPDLTHADVCAIDDYTFYIKKQDYLEGLRSDDRYAPALGAFYAGSYSDQITAVSTDGVRRIEGARALACSCYLGEHVSITLRSDRGKRMGFATGKPDWKGYWSAGRAAGGSRYCPRPGPGDRPADVEIATIGRTLYDYIFGDNPRAQGLLVVTGMTSSGKSLVARWLIDRYLKRQVGARCKKDRRPHLLTFEDPIEVRYADNPDEARALGVDYTPRQKGVDSGSLSQSIGDALRQTPTVFYVGEVREVEHWKQLMEFAGTGHLVVTTGHAGSLVEAVDRILAAVGARTPAERGHYAQRLFAVIHQVKIGGVIIPTLWRWTPAGVAALVDDGLASILPHSPVEGLSMHISSIGRRHLAGKILDRSPRVDADARTKIIIEAAEMDLQGI